MNRGSVRTILLAAIGVLILAAGIAVAWFLTALRPAGTSAETVPVTIESGDGVNDIADHIDGLGLIRSKTAFALYVMLEGLDGSLKAGTYDLSVSMSVEGIAATIVGGTDTSRETTVTFLEGWTINEMGSALEEKDMMTAEAFADAANVTDSRDIIPGEPYAFLTSKPDDHGLEGYLFPDTYRLYVDATPASVVQKLLMNFDAKLTDELRDEIAASRHTIHEIVTMASVLESEVRTDTDKALVADIFWRRIDAGIPMQSDATVNYVTGKDLAQPTIADTETDNPYNTYQYQGLPPGPIGNPGLASIVAAIHPEPNDNWYYLSTPEGETVYSGTFEEHKANKARYLQ